MAHSYSLFERDFSDNAPQVEFSIEELEMHKKQAYLDGYDAGAAQAQSELRSILSKMSGQIDEVLVIKNKALLYATEIAAKTCETLFPKYSQVGALIEVQGAVEAIFKKLHEEGVYTIRCAPHVSASLEEVLIPFKESMQFVVEADASFQGSDLSITWNNGFIWRSEVELYEHIKGVLEAYKEMNHE